MIILSYLRRRALLREVNELFRIAHLHNHPASFHPQLIKIAVHHDSAGLLAVTMCAADMVVKGHNCPHGPDALHALQLTDELGMPVEIDEAPPPIRTALRIILAHAHDDEEQVRALWEAATSDGGASAALAVAGTATQIAMSRHARHEHGNTCEEHGG